MSHCSIGLHRAAPHGTPTHIYTHDTHARHDMTGHDTHAWHARHARHGTPRHDTYDTARHDTHDTARHDMQSSAALALRFARDTPPRVLSQCCRATASQAFAAACRRGRAGTTTRPRWSKRTTSRCGSGARGASCGARATRGCSRRRASAARSTGPRTSFFCSRQETSSARPSASAGLSGARRVIPRAGVLDGRR